MHAEINQRRQASPPIHLGASIRAAAERAREARWEADRLACQAWNARMLAYKGSAQPSPTVGDALNGGYGYLEVRCLGCPPDCCARHHRRPKATPIHQLKRYLRCKDCSQAEVIHISRSQLVALWATKISARDPPSGKKAARNRDGPQLPREPSST